MAQTDPVRERLTRVAVVLVDTSHPGNIGAVARASKNMGIHCLRLVRPRQFPHADATARASGADDLLARAEVFDTLEEAIADAALVYGASARRRSLQWPEQNAREAAREILSKEAQVSVVFGNERSGLSNAELDCCHRLLHISANPEYSSLNLAMAVQVVTHELRMAATAGYGAGDDGRVEAPFATSAQVEALYEHYQRTLTATGFLNPDNPRHLMRRLRRLYNRVGLDDNEVQILRGILSAHDAALAAAGGRSAGEDDSRDR
ncbi:MAG: RNA methyltransferase [Pseudomonadota bacterium]